MTLLLLLTGAGTTNAPVVYTGLAAFGVDSRRRIEALDVPGKTLSGMSVRRRIEALDVRTREAVYTPALITLEDGTGYWLFEDGTRIVWEPGDTGTAGQVKKRLGNLQVKRDG